MPLYLNNTFFQAWELMSVEMASLTKDSFGFRNLESIAELLVPKVQILAHVTAHYTFE